MENRLGDLWSLFDFLNPGLLGSAGVFKSFIKNLQTREQDQFAPLRRLVGPYILRRLKTDRSVIADLPEKTETTRYCSLTKKQIGLYEQAVRQMRAALDSADGMARRGLVLQTLMRLKQICNHPSQLSGDGDYSPPDSGKFVRLDEARGRQEGGTGLGLAVARAVAEAHGGAVRVVDPLHGGATFGEDLPGLSQLNLHPDLFQHAQRGLVNPPDAVKAYRLILPAEPVPASDGDVLIIGHDHSLNGICARRADAGRRRRRVM